MFAIGGLASLVLYAYSAAFGVLLVVSNAEDSGPSNDPKRAALLIETSQLRS